MLYFWNCFLFLILARKVFEQLSIDQFVPKQVGTRVLSCGEGEQLGHPGRNVTRKPRAIDTFDDGTKFVQVCMCHRPNYILV